MSGIEITRRDLTAGELRGAAGKSRDAKAARRMLALALVLEGVDRTRAAETCGMDRQTLRDWVHLYNAEGLAGLSDRWKGVQVPHLSPAQMAELGASRRRGQDGEREEDQPTCGHLLSTEPTIHRFQADDVEAFLSEFTTEVRIANALGMTLDDLKLEMKAAEVKPILQQADIGVRLFRCRDLPERFRA